MKRDEKLNWLSIIDLVEHGIKEEKVEDLSLGAVDVVEHGMLPDEKFSLGVIYLVERRVQSWVWCRNGGT